MNPNSHPLGRLACLAAALALCLALVSCAGKKPPPPRLPGAQKPYQINGKWYQPLPNARDFTERGFASWYGEPFHGRKTASGETYDMHDLTAAHKTLPLGTRVFVKNLDNGKTANLRVNDRGPFVPGRIIDLSYAAAKNLGVVGPGTARVEIKAIAGPMDVPADDPDIYYEGNFTIQVGAFKDPGNAERLSDKLSARYKNVHVVKADVGGETFYRVRVAAAKTLDEAADYRKALAKDGFACAYVVAE
ncbi:MAG: septal ring lytic transglycosylase RlpA family protein [Thermodesulfobacteriota bacterium]